MVAEIQKCAEAGMNDHVSKPVDPARLFAVLAKWIKPLPDGTARPHFVQPARLLDLDDPADILPAMLPGVDIATALTRVQGNRRLYLSLLKDFARGFTGFVAQILAARDDGDFQTIARKAHTLKGVAGNLGAMDLSRAAGALESAAKHQDASRFEEFVSAIQVEIAPLLDAIAGLNVGAGAEEISAPAMVMEPARLQETIARLDALLQDNDLSAEEEFAALKPLFTGQATAEAVQQLETCLAGLDFKQARSALERLARSVPPTSETE